jgi:hypothetical protein
MNQLSTQVFRGKPIGSDQMTPDQAKLVGYFFFRLKACDPIEYDRMMPDPKTEAIIKREYAGYILSLNREKIDRGFAYWHDRRQAGDPDYRFMNIDRLLGLVNDSSAGVAAHKYFLPSPPETAEQLAARKAIGREKMKSITSIFE